MCPYFFAPCCTLTKPTSLRRILRSKTVGSYTLRFIVFLFNIDAVI